MKKIIAVFAAAAALCGASLNTSAADFSSESPTLYFSASENEDITILPGGRVYVDTSAHNGDTVINAGAYCYDPDKATSAIFVKWECKSENIKLTDITDPITAAGACPYKRWTDAKKINVSSREADNFMAVSYSTVTSETFELTGERSDDYPLACFNASVAADTPAGVYSVDFITEGENLCSIAYSDPIKDIIPTGEFARSLDIAVSDRALGDVNNSGKLEATDATKVLVAYASINAGEGSGLTAAEEIAADLTGDGKISANDASLILVKYADLSGNK